MDHPRKLFFASSSSQQNPHLFFWRKIASSWHLTQLFFIKNIHMKTNKQNSNKQQIDMYIFIYTYIYIYTWLPNKQEVFFFWGGVSAIAIARHRAARVLLKTSWSAAKRAWRRFVGDSHEIRGCKLTTKRTLKRSRIPKKEKTQGYLFLPISFVLRTELFFHPCHIFFRQKKNVIVSVVCCKFQPKALCLLQNALRPEKKEAGRPPECSFLLIYEIEISQLITSFHHHIKIKTWNLTIFLKCVVP